MALLLCLSPGWTPLLSARLELMVILSLLRGIMWRREASTAIIGRIINCYQEAKNHTSMMWSQTPRKSYPLKFTLNNATGENLQLRFRTMATSTSTNFEKVKKKRWTKKSSGRQSLQKRLLLEHMRYKSSKFSKCPSKHPNNCRWPQTKSGKRCKFHQQSMMLFQD